MGIGEGAADDAGARGMTTRHRLGGLDAAALVVPDARHPMRVLAAEDHPVFQAMLKTMLTKWGYQAVMARNGTDACRILEEQNAPRLAVLDWMMPGMDGVEIAVACAVPIVSPMYTFFSDGAYRGAGPDRGDGRRSG